MQRFKNLVQIHEWQAQQLGPHPALRYKRLDTWHDLAWDRYRADALACAAALIDAGIQPGDRVGLLSDNCIQWLIADMGILTAAGVNVPPHAALSARQVHFELQDAGARWVFVSNHEQLEKVRAVSKELPDVEGIAVFDTESSGPDAISWSTFLQRGRHALDKLTP